MKNIFNNDFYEEENVDEDSIEGNTNIKIISQILNSLKIAKTL